ncbi:proton-conducting transporter membrane subunit [Mycolicibacterium sp. CR10]|uniref:proton-conducting transporter transmembrane domain-containing protein n=1 Tax=Mycolicibacterium sp. CR10 TaxID=2562314 RepID=UPI0010BFE900|nr:proton-conducting transporter membrane subunit [Mycolicibacterium sp. CR10]
MLVSIQTAAFVAVVTAPLLTTLVAPWLGQRAPMLTARLGATVAGSGFIVAAGLAASAARGDVATAGAGVFAVAADRLAVAVLLLIFGVSAVAQAFAVRYLAGDPRMGWFTGGASLLTAGSVVLVTASTLVGIAVGWTAAGVALCLLLGTYWQLPSARDGVRRTAAAFLIGDAALWGAVGLIGAQSGTVALAEAPTAQIEGPLAAVVAMLIVTAALSRCAQIPFHRWLPATLAAPTPVSALLHAGVVNAGGILLIRLSPLPSPALAAGLVVVAGAATMAYGAAIMLVKPDIKGALVYSTMAQMGFMLLSCGLGLWAATVIHLFAHGFYKATLFLSSGSAIARHRRHAGLPAAPPLTGHRRLFGVATAAALPLAALYAAMALIPDWTQGHAAEKALLFFAWVTGAAATWGWLQRRPTISGALGAAVLLLPAAAGYLAIVGAISAFLAPALPTATVPAPAVWAVVAAAVVVLAALAAVRWSPGASTLHRALYTHALGAGTIHPATTGAHR